VLPILTGEFGVSPSTASLTVSAVVLGIALANLPFGVLADRMRILPIVLAGSAVVALASLTCALTRSIGVLIGARFVQGLFIPSMTTCLAAHLSRTLPPERLNVMMGWYVSATVAGGLGGRLLGGFAFPPEHWRWAFVAAGALVVAAALSSLRLLKDDPRARGKSAGEEPGFASLLARPDLIRMLSVAFCAFFVFSAIFNYIPFYLSGPPIGASVRIITLVYLAYVMGIAAGPLAGRLTNRFGAGRTLVSGSAAFALAIALTLVPSLPVIAVGLALTCAAFFTMHATAVGSLNARLTGSRGRANSLYVLLYYLGGAAGISATGAAYARWGWKGVAALGFFVLLAPLSVGMIELGRKS